VSFENQAALSGLDGLSREVKVLKIISHSENDVIWLYLILNLILLH